MDGNKDCFPLIISFCFPEVEDCFCFASQANTVCLSIKVNLCPLLCFSANSSMIGLPVTGVFDDPISICGGFLINLP